MVDNPNIALSTGIVSVIPPCGSLSFLGGLDGFLHVTLPVLNGSVCSTPTPSVINRWINNLWYLDKKKSKKAPIKVNIWYPFLAIYYSVLYIAIPCCHKTSSKDRNVLSLKQLLCEVFHRLFVVTIAYATWLSLILVLVINR